MGDKVPYDSEQENQSNFARCMSAFATLREKIAAAKPDVLVVFGDDQYEQFRFSNLPFALCLADSFSGTDPAVFSSGLMHKGWPDESQEHRVSMRGHPELGKQLLVLAQMGLADRVLAIALARFSCFPYHTPSGSVHHADVSRLKTAYPFITVVPQIRLLDLIVSEAWRCPTFRLAAARSRRGSCSGG